MSDPSVATEEPQPAPSPAGEQEPGKKGRLRTLTGEAGVELYALPVIVIVVFLLYVWWRQTANLDSTTLSILDWRAIRDELIQHIELTVVTSAIVVLLAVPLGIMVTRGRARIVAPLVVGFANGGQAAPSIGLIVLLAIWLGIGFWTAILALVIYGLLPVLRNTITGLQGVDPTLVEAGRGIGMSGAAVLLRIELPLALPVIMTGIRTALVLVVGTAALATFISAGGLGTALVAAIELFRFPAIIASAVLIALLALLVEWVGRVLEIVFRPKGI
ncbi:MAG: ABC transporter permease [Marmoricola sp.]